MSRVSEALERASAEIPQPVGKFSHPRGSRLVEEREREGIADGNAQSNFSGEAQVVDAAGSISEPSWSLGKRLQGVMFGKGLEKYKEFALVFQEKQSVVAEQ